MNENDDQTTVAELQEALKALGKGIKRQECLYIQVWEDECSVMDTHNREMVTGKPAQMLNYIRKQYCRPKLD